MNKEVAISIIIQCALAYRRNLENSNLLIVSQNRDEGFPAYHETLFLARHFLHLSGIKVNPLRISSSVHFYEQCLAHRLQADDFDFALDGTTILKLDILPVLMQPNLSAKMIGDYAEQSLRLITQKVVGSIKACMGFVYDMQTGYYIPNTALKKDTREATQNTYSRIIAIFQKSAKDKQYMRCVYQAKGVSLDTLTYPLLEL